MIHVDIENVSHTYTSKYYLNMQVSIQNGETLLSKFKITVRSSLIFGVFLVGVMITFLYFTSTNNSLMISTKLDNRYIIQNRFRERLETLEAVCAKENLKDKYDLKSHLSQ